MNNPVTYNRWKSNNEAVQNKVVNNHVIVSKFSNFEFVDIKLRLFIPSEIIFFEPKIISTLIEDVGFGGDNRTFSYSLGTSRCDLFTTIDLNPDTEDYISLHKKWYPTKKYSIDDIEPVKNKPKWFWKKKNQSVTPIEQDTLEMNENNLSMDVFRIKKYEGHSLSNSRVTLKVAGSNPLLTGSPQIDFRAQIYLIQTTDGVKYKLNIGHDKFPANELYINEKLVYSFDPVRSKTTPINLFPYAGLKYYQEDRLKSVPKIKY